MLILALVLASVPGRALADPGRSVRTYRDTIENATAAFAAGRFGDARAAFEVAYAIHPDPVLVFNIASCWRRAGDTTQALVEYRRFLMLAPPDDERRPLATVTIASLEQDLQPREPELLRLEPPEPEPLELTAILSSPAAAPAPAPRRSRLRPLWIGLGALGGLGAVTGVVELARSRMLDTPTPAPAPAPSPAPSPTPDRDRDGWGGNDGDRDDDDWGGGDGDRNLTARSRPVAVAPATGERDGARRRAILLGVSGAALIAASVTVYYFGKRAERRALRLSVSGGGGGSSVVLGGQF